MIDRLKVIANKLLESNNIDNAHKERIKVISEILDEDKCFFKMDIDTAFSLLSDLNFSKEEIKILYEELIDSNNY